MRNLVAIAVLVGGLLLARHNGAVLVAALVIAWFVAGTGRAGRAVAGRGMRRVAVRTHGGHGTKTAARHEAGHRQMAKANGWHVESTQIFKDGPG